MSNTFAHGYALLIGVDESADERLALPAVARDVTALHRVLVHPARCAYPADHVHTITGADATRQGILAGLSWLQERVENDTCGNVTALVYYSGHGWRDTETQRYYLIPHDVNRAWVSASSLPAADFAAALMTLLPRRLLVVLDCCHAAGMGVKDLHAPAAPDVAQVTGGRFQAAPAPVAPLLPDPDGVRPDGAKGLEQLQTGAGRAVLTSCRGSEKSYIRADGQMSIFTYHLIEALTGHAQPAAGAAQVLVSDLLGHVHRTVPASARADWQAAQHPDFVASGNFPVALLLGGKGVDPGAHPPDPLAPESPAMHATHLGSGGVAQGPGAVAAGERGVAIRGDARDSTIVTGDQNRVQRARGRNIAQAGDGGSATVNDQSSRSLFDQRGQTVGNQTNIAGDVHTGGGLVNTGSIHTGGGDLVGRDKRVAGDEVRGDKVQGDKIAGDKVDGDKIDGDKIEGDNVAGDKVAGDKTGGDQITAHIGHGSRNIAVGKEIQQTDTGDGDAGNSTGC